METLYTNEGSLKYDRGTNFWGLIEKIAKGCHLKLETTDYSFSGDRVNRKFCVTGTKGDISNWKEIILTMNDLYS
jgi:hypothetical protein